MDSSPFKNVGAHKGGYKINKFEGKEAQMKKVVAFVAEKGFIPEHLVEAEVVWFYNNLGIDNMYFCLESPERIAHHIMSLYSAKMSAYLRSATSLDISVEEENADSAVYIHSSRPGVSVMTGPQYEQRIDERYLDPSNQKLSFRMESYRSSGVVASDFATQLRCYFIARTDFVNPEPSGKDFTDIRCVSDKIFLSKASQYTLNIYERVMRAVLERTGPVIEMHESTSVFEALSPYDQSVAENSNLNFNSDSYNDDDRTSQFSDGNSSVNEDFANGRAHSPNEEVLFDSPFNDENRPRRLIIGYRQQSTQRFFSAISDLYHYYDLYSTSKYVENFSNGVTILCIYLMPLPNSGAPPIEHSILQIMREASLIFCLPQTSLQPLFKSGILSVQETIYGYSGLVFAQHFLNRLGPEYSTLASVLDSQSAQHVGILEKIKKRLRQETFTREYILDIVRQYPDLIRVLFVNFAMKHYVSPPAPIESFEEKFSECCNFKCTGEFCSSTFQKSRKNGRHLKKNTREHVPYIISNTNPTRSDDAMRQTNIKPTLSFQRLQKDKALTEAEVRERIRRVVCNQHEQIVFEAFLTFNTHLLKTNFYQPTKVALAFRFDPAFLPKIEYPMAPYGMFLVLGSEFRGFHIRFRDIARGGIRIIRSRNREAYSINLRTLFDENYHLASTQQRKNKDIPEGGSKGTILLDSAQQGSAQVAFEKYIDALLDLLLVVPVDNSICDSEKMMQELPNEPKSASSSVDASFSPISRVSDNFGSTQEIEMLDSNVVKKIFSQSRIVDLYKKPEILFLGPDEGTADYMDWASQHARKRGAPFWKAFTTGKSQALGGIPHDLYGMTTRSIHQYVLGIYEKLGIDETACRKFQTGGPDGDLGSNEIKISKDRTTAIVDGSGVLYDPEGIDRVELMRLANERRMIASFDVRLLSPGGFCVLIDEIDVILPDGRLIEDGLAFRNEFHLHFKDAELFVPCGGRPEAVDINNVSYLLDSETGRSRYRFIVEGANLFFTQDARLRLETGGALIFKDASANKGGVTSSSMEVLAALTLSDEEFRDSMQVLPLADSENRSGLQSSSHINDANTLVYNNNKTLSQTETEISDVIPTFYQNYVKEVQNVIEKNARLEFECLWREHCRVDNISGVQRPLSLLSDDLSIAILKLDEELQSTTVLWDNEPLRELVLSEAVPAMLIERVGGLKPLIKRLPLSYTRALFSSYLASRFVYAHGVAPSQFAFFEFMSSYYDRIVESTTLTA